ncbi:MAG: tRNA 2-thiocytidine biosynthesis protein TtcA [Oscillospiraceae bacterium]|nr:tRNA 2-thiocytidine biosynthesis protein TtcA [Oscillospiraceae bacterium]
MDTLNSFTGLVRRCVDDYGMIAENDRICVGVSGGKDSLILLLALRHLQTFYPLPFELEAVTVDAGFPDMDFSPVERLCEEIGVKYTRLTTDIREIVFDIRQESNPCSLCSKMRKGALNNYVRDNGFNKLALGHHFDDAVETFMMSLLLEGRLSCFKPVTYMSRSGVTQIRPMLYAGEKRVANLADTLAVPVIHNTCPEDKTSKRAEFKALLAALSQQYPDLRSKVFGAMQRLPLDGWGPQGR